MKKIVIIIILFLAFIYKVSAEQLKFGIGKILDNIYYVKDNGKKLFYRNAAKIIDLNTNEQVYCVQPFVDLIDTNTYVEYKDYDRVLGFSNEKWKRISLIAYYGYGYKNHLEDKWITITQLSIWRDTYPEYRYDWIDNLKSKKVITPYNREIEELKRLVNTHDILPSFKNSYEMGINDELVIVDNNRVLENFDVVSSDFKIKKEGNILKITSDKEIEGIISFVKAKNIYKNRALYYYSSKSQTVVKNGNVDEKRFIINIKVKKGRVEVNKIDEESSSTIPQGEASLDGAIYEILDHNMNKIKELEIKDNYLVFDDLKIGKYFIREVKSGNGYYLDKKIYEVEVSLDNLEREITLTNKVIKSKINISKYYGTKDELDNNKGRLEENVMFDIFDINRKVVKRVTTNKEGQTSIFLPFGRYVIKQVNTKKGYKMIEDYYLNVNENNNVSQDIIFYDLKIEVPNAGL